MSFAGNSVYRIDPYLPRGGNRRDGLYGDGGPAKEAKLSGPKGIAWAPDNSLYLADTESHTIRRIDLKSGIITTVLRGLKRPHGIFVAKDGTVYVADSESLRVLPLK